MSRLDEFKESAQKRRENLGLDYKSSKETYSKPKNKLESFKNNAQKRREEVNKDILSPKRVATAYNPEDRDTVRNWIDRYNKVVKGISDYNAKRNGAYTLDASGGYAEDLEALIADFAEIKQYSRRYGVANPHMYLKQLEDLRDSISSINSEMAKFSTEDEYNEAWKAAQEYEQQKVLDITAAEKEIADLQAARDDYARNHEFDWTSAAERNAHDRYLQEQDELIAQKKRFANRAKNIQEGIRLSGAAENADFDNYNGYVSTYSDNVFSGFDGFNTAGYRDLTYEYINNQDGAREAIMQMDESQSLINVEGGTRALKEKGYEFMTEDEVGIYNYYYAKEGKEKAQTYLDNIQETLNQRKATSLFGKMEDKTALELAFGMAAGIDQFQSGMENLFKDEEYIPASSYQIASQMVRQDLRDVGKKLPGWLGGASVGQMAYDTLTTTANMVPSMILSMGLGMINPAAGQAAGTALMGASAMGNAYQEALNLGYDKGQAKMYSALVGGSEAGLQYLLGGIGKLGGILPEGATAQILNGVDNAFARTAIKIGGNMLSEGFEEGLQEILTPWFQNLALHAGEDINWSEVAYSSLLGALTATAMEGGSTVAGEVQTYRTGSQLEAAGITAQQIADIGTTFSADTVAHKLAGRVDENTGAYTMGRLFQEIDANLTEQNVNDIVAYLKAKGMPENIAKVNARAMERVVAGEKLTQRQIAVIEGNEILAEAMRTTIIAPNSTWYQRTNQHKDILKQRQEYQNASRMNPDAQATENAPSGNTVDTENKEGTENNSEAFEDRTEPYSVKRISAIKDGKATVVLEDDTESNVRDAYISSDDGVRIETIAGIDGISTQDANFILSTLKVNPGANAQVDSLGAKEAYKYGYFGFSKEHLTKHGVFANALIESQRDAIYAAGQEARQQQDNAATPKKAGSSGKTTGVYFDAGKGKVTAYRESDQKTLTDKQKAGVQAAMVLQKLGIGGDIYFFESYRNSEGKLVYTDSKGKERPAPNGWYEKDGSIHIDLNAGAKGSGFVLFTLAHELTHFIEQWSPKKYRALAEFLTREYEKGESMDKRVRAKQLALYESRGKSVSYGEAYSEVVADSMEAMLADGNVLDKLSKLKAQDKTIFDKMKEFFDNLAAKIRSIYKGMTPDSAEGRAVMEMKDAIEELQQLFTEGLVEASKNFQGSYASEKAEKLAAQSREEVRYSDREQNAKKITMSMTDSERTEILKDKVITAAVYTGQADKSIASENDSLNSHRENLVKAALVKIGEEFGVFTDYSIADVDVDFRLSRGNLKESVSKKIDPVQIAKLLPVLKAAVENAIGIECHANRYFYDNNTVMFENLISGYMDGGFFIPVRFGLRHSVDGKATLYLIVDQEKINVKKIKAEVAKATEMQNANAYTSRSAFNISLASITPFVNSKDILRYFPDDMLTDSQRKAKWEAIAETIVYTNNKNDSHYAEFIRNGNIVAAKRMVQQAAKVAGYIIKAYHGTSRSDRVGNVFLPERATSGPMAFFTDNRDIAEHYAKDKKDTSIAYDEEYADYYSQFRVNRNGKSIKIQDLWRSLPYSEKQRLKEAGKHITWDEDMENIVWDKDATRGLGNWDVYTLNEHKGNAIEALIDCWLESGELFGNERDFLKVLDLAGIKGVEYRDPDARYEKVYETFLNIQNPFNTATVDESFTSKFEEWYNQQPEGKYDRNTAAADMWDKNSQTAKKFIERLRDDIQNGTSYAWTSIPDSMTDYLKYLGHDGIQDTGGKNGGETHTVWIPFMSEQIKSADVITYDDNGEIIPISQRFNQEKEDICYQDRPAESISNRSLLADAFEGIAKTELEKKRIQEYRAKIRQIDAEEENLRAINAQLKDETDPKAMRQLQIAAIQATNRINIFDKQLLRLEATKPLQDVITREKKKSYDAAALRGKEALEAYRQRAEQKQAETVKRYQDARDRGIENRQKTALRQKIRKVIRDLDKILNRGNKKRNVKEDIKDFVAEALHSAEVLFMDTYTNEDMVFYGVQTDLTPEEAKFMEEAKGILEELRNMPTGYEGWEARQEKEAKLKGRLAYRMGKLKDVFVRERARLNRTQVSEVLGNLADAYKNLETSEHLYVKDAFHENVYQYLLQLKEDIGGTIVRDMSIQQLEELYKGYQMVMTTVQNANRMFAENLNMTRDALANRVMTEVKTAGGQHGLWTKAGEKVNQFLWNNQKAVYAFEWIGSETLKKLYGNIRKGQDTWAVDMQEANAFRQKMYHKYNRSKWNFDKQYKFKSSFDEEFALNLEQIMSLYAYSRREQAHEHLLKGGFVFDGNTEEIVTKGKFKRKYLKKDATAYNLPMGVYEQIISTLTAEQKAFVEEMQGYLSDTMGNKGNDVSMQLYGVKLFNEKFYFPLRSAGQYMERAKEADLKKEQGQINLVNSGFAKATKIRASNPVVLSGFMDVWADHVNEMSMYHSFVLPMEDFRRVYNYSSPHLEESASSSVNQVIENAYGSAATAYIDQLYRDLNGGAIVDSRENLFKNMVGKFKKAAVFASASVTIQQPSAIGRAFAYIDPKYFVGAKVDAKRHKALWEEVKKYAPVAFIKEMGYFDTGMGQSAKDYLTSEEHTGIKDKVKAMFSDEGFRDEALGKLPGLADEITWCAIWEAVKRETRAKHPGMNMKSDAFLQIAGDRFSEVIDKTQVYDSVLARSANMRSKGTFMAIATSFMAEPTTSINMLEDALRKYRKGGNANKKHAKAVIASVFTSVLLNSILVSFVYAARDDDEDETYLEKYTSSFVTEMLDGVNPVTYYPFLKDIWSSLQGYDIERADMSLITALVDASQKVFDVMTKDTYGMTEEEYNEHQKDIVAAMWGVVDSISSLMGIPLKNLRRDINGGINLMKTTDADIHDRDTSWSSMADELQETLANAVPVVGKKLFGETKAEKLYDAMVRGDTAYADRLKQGYKDENAVLSVLSSEVKKQFMQRKISAMEATNQLFTFGMEINDAMWRVDEWQYQLDTGSAEGYSKYKQWFDAIEAGDDLAPTVQKYLDGGVKEETLRSQISSHFKPKYVEMTEDEREAFKPKLEAALLASGTDRWDLEDIIIEWDFEAKYGDSYDNMIQAFKDGEFSREDMHNILLIRGYEAEDAEKKLNEWEFTAKYGFSYDEREDGYKDGLISAQDMRQALMTIGGKTPEEADQLMEAFEYLKAHPEVNVYASRVVYWQRDIEDLGYSIEDTGMSLETYLAEYDAVKDFTADKDENGNSIPYSKINKAFPYINGLNLTPDQKTALAVACGWAISTVNKNKLW